MKAIDMLTGSPVTLRWWDGSRWVGASTASGNLTQVSPPAGPVKNIVAGGALMNVSVAPASNRGVLVAARMKAVVDAAAPVCEFDLVFLGDSAQAESTTIQCAVATDSAPTPKPVTFAGATSITVANPRNVEAVTVRTDPLPLNIKAGDSLIFYGHAGAGEGRAVGDSAGYTPGLDAWWAAGSTFEKAWGAQHIEGGTLAATNTVFGARPARVLAPSDKPAWLLAGDSIIHFYRSHAQRWATGAGVAWAKNATGGGTHASALTTWETNYVPSLQGATHMLDELGINGVTWPFSEAMDYWRRARSAGIKAIVKTTLTPRANSADKWATVEGQTAAFAALYDAFDAWLLDGAPMKADWSSAVPVGTTGEDIVRAPVVASDFIVKPGVGAHVFGAGGVVDWNPSVSAAGVGGSRRIYRTDLGLSPADYGDGLHFGNGIHEVLAGYLKRAVPLAVRAQGDGG